MLASRPAARVISATVALDPTSSSHRKGLAWKLALGLLSLARLDDEGGSAAGSYCMRLKSPEEGRCCRCGKLYRRPGRRREGRLVGLKGGKRGPLPFEIGSTSQNKLGLYWGYIGDDGK